MKLASLWMGLLLAVSVCGQTRAARQIPTACFFQDSAFGYMELSPDGKHFAAITVGSTNSEVMVVNIDSHVRTPMRGGFIHNLHWFSNDRLLLEQGIGGLVAVNRDGSNLKQLLNPIFLQLALTPYLDLFELLALHTDDPDCVLVESYRLWSGRKLPNPNVMRLNINTGKTFLEEKNPGSVVLSMR